MERAGNIAWEPEKDITVVKRILARNTPIVTRRSYEVHGAISDQQIVGAQAIIKAKGVGYIPVKGSDERLCDTQKYGGFNKVSGAYFFLVEHIKKKKLIRTIENLPVYLADKYAGKEGLEEYCRNILELEDPDVRWDKIRMYSLLKINGFRLYLTGRSNNRLLVCNAVELALKKEYSDYIREVVRAAEGKYDESRIAARSKRIAESENSREIAVTAQMNIKLYDELTKKHQEGIYSKRPNPIGGKLIAGRDKFISLDLSRQCYVLNQILLISQLLNQGADLQDLGEAKKSGVSAVSKEITDLNECKLILQSVTGLYEQEIDLQKI